MPVRLSRHLQLACECNMVFVGSGVQGTPLIQYGRRRYVVLLFKRDPDKHLQPNVPWVIHTFFVCARFRKPRIMRKILEGICCQSIMRGSDTLQQWSWGISNLVACLQTRRLRKFIRREAQYTRAWTSALV